MTSPNSGTEIWQVGTSQNITWTINGTGITGLKLEYSTNGFADETQTFVIGGSDVTPVPPTPASYSWTIPNSVGTVQLQDPEVAPAGTAVHPAIAVHVPPLSVE